MRPISIQPIAGRTDRTGIVKMNRARVARLTNNRVQTIPRQDRGPIGKNPFTK